MPTFRLTFTGTAQFEAGLTALGDGQAVLRFGQRAALLVETRAKENASGKVLQVRGGQGRARITRDTAGLPSSFIVGSPDRYMRAHETGAHIVARGKLLTIPLDAAKTAKGAPRFTAREAAGRFQSTFWRQSRRGNPILFGKTGDRLTPLFVGKPSVTLPRRPWLSRAFDEGVPDMEILLVKSLQERLGTA